MKRLKIAKKEELSIIKPGTQISTAPDIQWASYYIAKDAQGEAPDVKWQNDKSFTIGGRFYSIWWQDPKTRSIDRVLDQKEGDQLSENIETLLSGGSIKGRGTTIQLKGSVQAQEEDSSREFLQKGIPGVLTKIRDLKSDLEGMLDESPGPDSNAVIEKILSAVTTLEMETETAYREKIK